MLQVTNVDDEGNELGSGIMELTQTELILHTRKRDAIRWPYLCLRRYGYDSNLFSFESGRRCQTGQGEIFFDTYSIKDYCGQLLFKCILISLVLLVRVFKSFHIWKKKMFKWLIMRSEFDESCSKGAPIAEYPEHKMARRSSPQLTACIFCLFRKVTQHIPNITSSRQMFWIFLKLKS